MRNYMVKNYACCAFAIIFIILGCASAAAGTREDPIPMGTPVDLGDGWQVTVLSVLPDATNAVLQENQFNDPPAQGNQFFLARVRFAYLGEGSASPNANFRLRAVGPESIGYSTFENSAGVIPDEIANSELFTGGSVEGNVGWEIKSSDASSLVMYDSPLFGDNTNRIYIALHGGAISTSQVPALSTYNNCHKTMMDGMRLSFKLGQAYGPALQGQDIAAFNSLVDQYNAFVRANFGEDPDMLMEKMY
jgi:hypothetical protein